MWLNDFSLAGTPKAAQVFANELSKRDYDVCIVTYNDTDHIRSINLIDGVHFMTVDRQNKQKDFSFITEKFKPDIIHAFLSGYREFPDPGIDFPKKIPFIMHSVFGHRNNNVDNVIYMSKYLMDVSLKSNHKSYFVDNPTLIPYTNDNNRKLIGASKNTIILTRSGRPENGIYTGLSVAALGKFFVHYPSLKNNILFYVLAPPPNMIKDLRQNNIPFVVKGSTVNEYGISKFYNTSDIHLHDRGDGESGGSCIMEAMIHGKSIITHYAQSCEAHPYPFQNQCFLVEDQVTGFVVDHNVESYAIALLKLIDNPSLRSQMGAIGRGKALREFEAGVCVDKLERIYKEILNV